MFTIISTVKIIISYLDILAMFVIVYMDLYSLYKYLSKLSIIKKKCLIIDIIALY
jgi:hypothetical protein